MTALRLYDGIGVLQKSCEGVDRLTNASGLSVDAKSANIEVSRWLREVANARVLARTGWPSLSRQVALLLLRSFRGGWRGEPRTREALHQTRNQAAAATLPVASPGL